MFVEVKRKDDARLLQPKEHPEALYQLSAYCRRIQNYRTEFMSAYRKVAVWKRELGLGGRLSQLPVDGPLELLDKPILVIGNCSSTDVQQIKNAEGEWGTLMTGLKTVAAGLILCGTNGCRLNLKNGPQTISFLL